MLLLKLYKEYGTSAYNLFGKAAVQDVAAFVAQDPEVLKVQLKAHMEGVKQVRGGVLVRGAARRAGARHSAAHWGMRCGTDASARLHALRRGGASCECCSRWLRQCMGT